MQYCAFVLGSWSMDMLLIRLSRLYCGPENMKISLELNLFLWIHIWTKWIYLENSGKMCMIIYTLCIKKRKIGIYKWRLRWLKKYQRSFVFNCLKMPTKYFTAKCSLSFIRTTSSEYSSIWLRRNSLITKLSSTKETALMLYFIFRKEKPIFPLSTVQWRRKFFKPKARTS